MADNINPSHYKSHPSGVECIEITRHHNFNIGNVIKYLWRAGLKDQDTLLEDLEKARWYLEDEIKRVKSSATIKGPATESSIEASRINSVSSSLGYCTRCLSAVPIGHKCESPGYHNG